MSDASLDALMLDLLEWIAAEPRTYAQVMEAWRTSCPRLPVWEDANDRGFVKRHQQGGGVVVVSLTESGRTFLAQRRG